MKSLGNLRKLTLLLCFINLKLFSQNISTELPVLSPQTPTTEGLGKYGEIQVNESTGLISPSIPLFNYNTGKGNIPVAINYSGNGVRVNQHSSWAGINWNINPGGVITRQVKDRADELTNLGSKRYYTEEYLNSLNGSSTPSNHQSTWWNTLLDIDTENTDNEVDIFNYNFQGYSGSFFFDTDYNAHLIKYDKEIAVTFQYNPENKSEIIITVSNGDKYYFGGYNASESARTLANTGAGTSANSDFTQNAFYLYKISYLTGGEINFIYTQNGSNTSFCENKIGIQESAKIMDDLGSYCITASKRDLIGETKNSVTLNKITNSITNQVVEFQTSTVNQCAGIYKLNKVLLKSIIQGQETLIKEIRLNYFTLNVENDNSLNKFFLEKVDFYGKNNQFINSYKLEYDSANILPSRNSFAQDEMGFYNGKPNVTLLPLTENILLDNKCANLANREAELDFAKAGSLKKIIYPTGGYTEFEYELPFKKQVKIMQDHMLTAFYSDPTRNYDSSAHTFNTNTQLHSYDYVYYPNDESLTLTENTELKLGLFIEAFGAFGNQNNVLFEVIKMSNNSVVWNNSNGYSIETVDNLVKNYSKNYTISLPPGQYRFRLSVNIHQSVCTCQNSTESNPIDSNNYVVANVILKLPTGGVKDIYNPGLRIKRVLTFDNNSTSQKIRYFYGSYTYNPNFIYTTRELINNRWRSFNNLSTNSVKNDFNSEIGNTYDSVNISYGGDNYENGGKTMLFIKNPNAPIIPYALTANYLYDPQNLWSTEYSFDYSNELASFVNTGSNDSYPNSTLYRETFFDKNFKKVKSIDYEYEGIVDFYMGNIKSYLFCGMTNGKVHFLYKTKSFKYRLKSTTSEEFFSNSLDSIKSITTNRYDLDKVSLPKEIETIDSKNISKTTKIYYPSDIASIDNLTSDDQINIPLLTNKHNISQIIKTENYVNQVLTDSKQISFKNFGGNILPSSIKVKKGNNSNTQLEDKIIFDEYNFYGNPEIVSIKDGIKTKYVYNSKQQVILKLENFNNDYIIDDGAIINTPCYYQQQYPNCMVTTYSYDEITDNLISVTDAKCNKTTYEYDAFNRLIRVKDNQGKILSENEYHYKN